MKLFLGRKRQLPVAVFRLCMRVIMNWRVVQNVGVMKEHGITNDPASKECWAIDEAWQRYGKQVKRAMKK